MTLNSHSSHPLPLADAAPHPVNLRPALEEVRRMSEFQPPEPDWTDGLHRYPLVRDILKFIEQGVHWLAKALHKVLDSLRVPGLEHLPDNIRDVFNGFLLFCLILLVLYALYLVLSLLLGLRQKQKGVAMATRNRSGERPADSASHYALAMEAARAGQYDQALRTLYIAALCLLDERRVAPYAEADTSGEYLTRLSRKAATESRIQACLNPFSHLSRLFEASRYGLKPVSSGRFDQGAAEFAQLREAVIPHD